jgi:hypothetical protein
MKRFNKILTVKWLAIGLIGISAILAVTKPATMPFWYFFQTLILPLIPLFGLVYWVLRSRKSWLAKLVTGIYSCGLLYVFLLVYAVEGIAGCHSTSTNEIWSKHLFSEAEILNSEHCGSFHQTTGHQYNAKYGLTRYAPWNGVHKIRFRDGTRQMITYEDGKLVRVEVDYPRRTE